MAAPSATVNLKLTVTNNEKEAQSIYEIFSPLRGNCGQYTVIPDDGSIEVPSSNLDGFTNFVRLKKDDYQLLPDGGVRILESKKIIPPPGQFVFKDDGSVIVSHLPEVEERVIASNLFKVRPDGSIIVINSGERIFPPFCPPGNK